jgi:serine/threonine protein phosphatase PrpC
LIEPGNKLRYRSSSATHVGAVRKLNEDSLLDSPSVGLWAIADGAGGHSAGDYASQTVVAGLNRIAPQQSAMDLLAAVRQQIEIANANLRAYAANEGVDITATTIAALLCFGQHYAAVWAGDSRVYLLRDGHLRLVTRDHSAVQELVDAGAITPEEALHHPHRNVVTRAVGAAGTIDVDMVQDRLCPSDIFLLCSDGLGKVVSDDEIATALLSMAGDAVADHLVEKALARNVPDNISLVVVECLTA